MRLSFHTLCITLVTVLLSALHTLADTTTTQPKMGFFELNIGIDVRGSKGNFMLPSQQLNQAYYNNALGVSGRMQSSFISNYLVSDKPRRLRVADVLSAEVGTGYFQSNQPVDYKQWWAYYRFEFGVGSILRLNANNDLGLNIMLLKFAVDRVSPNISGSFIQLRYRCHQLQLEAGLEGRRDRMFGWLPALNPDYLIPMQYQLGAKWLMKNRTALGIRGELLSKKGNQYVQNNLNASQSWTIRIFYGIYF